MKRSIWIALTSILVVAILFIGYYKQDHLSLWGFKIAKNNLKDVIVVTDEHSYMIKDKDAVLSIAKISSKMDKEQKIQSNNFPLPTQPKKLKKIIIQTNDNTTYGGHLWLLGLHTVIDSNGYYWNLDYEKMSNLVTHLLKNAEILN